MPIRIENPLIEEFFLEEIDKTYGIDATAEPTKIRIRQATQGAHEKRQGLFDKMQREIVDEEDGTRIVSTTHFNYAQLQRLEVFLTLSGCNIENAKGKPLFRFKNDILDMTESEFRDAWNTLPVDIAIAIHEKALEVNIGWKFAGGEKL